MTTAGERRADLRVARKLINLLVSLMIFDNREAGGWLVIICQIVVKV